jgi:hypothetical protein
VEGDGWICVGVVFDTMQANGIYRGEGERHTRHCKAPQKMAFWHWLKCKRNGLMATDRLEIRPSYCIHLAPRKQQRMGTMPPASSKGTNAS